MNRVKKKNIIDAAIDLFAKHGIAYVSLAMIAKELGATKGMIYHYYRNGKQDIIREILQVFEEFVTSSIPDPGEWEAEDADAKKILHRLFFQFPTDDYMKLRKITRIIMSEMFHNEQIALYAINYFIEGREKLIFNCFTALAANGKIVPLDAESAARYFNRLLVVCAIEDALRYPYIDDKDNADALQNRVVRDCTNFINFLLAIN